MSGAGAASPLGWKKNPLATANDKEACRRGSGEHACPTGELRAKNRMAGTPKVQSPTTPPRPVGSGHRDVGGNDEAKPAAQAAPTSQLMTLSPSLSTALLREKAPAPQRDGQKDGDRADAEELHQDVGRGAPGAPRTLRTGSAVAWLRLGS